ncbi:MAG: methyltransferase domain-containing protein [Bacteroidales bacterium]
MYTNWLNYILRYPESLKTLQCNGNNYESEGKVYKVENDILSIVYPAELGGDDEKYNKLYIIFAPLYDLNERVMGKLLVGVDMVKGREQIVSFLGLKPGMRILEVSPSPGVFQKYLRNDIGENGELVALDLSMGMLRQCQKRNKKLNVHLIHGNAQFLPFADNSFDALYHFGGINLFNDPQKAIDEFIRVVKKDGIVSWGDEGFSVNYRNERKKKLMLRINPSFAKPRPVIPDSVYDVKENEVYDGLAYLVVARKRQENVLWIKQHLQLKDLQVKVYSLLNLHLLFFSL